MSGHPTPRMECHPRAQDGGTGTHQRVLSPQMGSRGHHRTDIPTLFLLDFSTAHSWRRGEGQVRETAGLPDLDSLLDSTAQFTGLRRPREGQWLVGAGAALGQR